VSIITSNIKPFFCTVHCSKTVCWRSRQFGTSDEVSQDTSALVPSCQAPVWLYRNVLGPKCPGSEVSWHYENWVWLITPSDHIGLHRTTSDHVWPCLQMRDRNFKSEAKKRWNYLQGEQATRHTVSSLQVRPPQKPY